MYIQDEDLPTDCPVVELCGDEWVETSHSACNDEKETVNRKDNIVDDGAFGIAMGEDSILDEADLPGDCPIFELCDGDWIESGAKPSTERRNSEPCDIGLGIFLANNFLRSSQREEEEQKQTGNLGEQGFPLSVAQERAQERERRKAFWKAPLQPQHLPERAVQLLDSVCTVSDGQERWKEKRERLKAIWSSGTEAKGGPVKTDGAPIIKEGHSANLWESTRFPTTERKAKFLRLLGSGSSAVTHTTPALPSGAEATSTCIDAAEIGRSAGKADESSHASAYHDIHKVYLQSVCQKQHGRRGLGVA